MTFVQYLLIHLLIILSPSLFDLVLGLSKSSFRNLDTWVFALGFFSHVEKLGARCKFTGVNSVCDLGAELGLIFIQWEAKVLLTAVLCVPFCFVPRDALIYFGDPYGGTIPTEARI